MADATMAPTMAPATTRGLSLPCPLCGEADADIYLSLADGDTCRCGSCDNEFTLTDVRNLMAKWQKVLTWMDTMPS
ncbi:MAG: hypothetical protein JO110_14645 [Acetobacteraceae bacterium]|nr:hypothetical protein [Acetobacteraceae bacterium]